MNINKAERLIAGSLFPFVTNSFQTNSRQLCIFHLVRADGAGILQNNFFFMNSHIPVLATVTTNHMQLLLPMVRTEWRKLREVMEYQQLAVHELHIQSNTILQMFQSSIVSYNFILSSSGKLLSFFKKPPMLKYLYVNS
uniref:Uncharacterized protein n=1 Tax=Sphaerodactylus townsendi TaxID=933632 RepID=A0ACB8G330_9SAUR